MRIITVARKPLSGSVAQTVLKWGTGGLNIDGCRVGTSKPEATNTRFESWRKLEGREDRQNPKQTYNPNEGRWPANIILRASEEVLAGFIEYGITVSGATKREIDAYGGDGVTSILRGESNPRNQHGDFGSVARFFKQVKP